jgi:cytochrome P450
MTTNKIFFNPLDPDFHINPYPIYTRLREEAPVYKSLFNTWIVTRYSDAEAILKDKRFQVDDLHKHLQNKNRFLKEGNLNVLTETVGKWLFFLEPPDHTRLKGILTPAFSQTVVEDLRPEIQRIVDDLISKVEYTGKMDVIKDFATPLPALVIAKMLGLPIEDYQKLIKWSSKSIFIFDRPVPLEIYQEQNQIIIENRKYLLEKINEYKKEPNQGLISYLANAQDIASQLTTDEIISICILLSATAQESTKGLIGNGLLSLLNHPKSLDYAKQNPNDIKNIVEELLRYESPIQFVSRVATEDVEIKGNKIRSGEYVIIYIGAANRDPEQFTNPDQLDFNRRNRNLAFGSGIHYCLGMFLAKVEVQIAINTLLKRLINIRIDTATIDWHESNISRRLKALPIKFGSFL